MSNADVRYPEIDFVADPLANLHEVLSDLRASESVSRIQFAGQPIWLVNDHETVSKYIGSVEILSAPDAYDSPCSFQIHRGSNHLSFGHGEHFCLGTQMARRVIEKAVEFLSTRYPEMALCPDVPAEILGGVLRGPQTLCVTL